MQQEQRQQQLRRQEGPTPTPTTNSQRRQYASKTTTTTTKTTVLAVCFMTIILSTTNNVNAFTLPQTFLVKTKTSSTKTSPTTTTPTTALNQYSNESSGGAWWEQATSSSRRVPTSLSSWPNSSSSSLSPSSLSSSSSSQRRNKQTTVTRNLSKDGNNNFGINTPPVSPVAPTTTPSSSSSSSSSLQRQTKSPRNSRSSSSTRLNMSRYNDSMNYGVREVGPENVGGGGTTNVRPYESAPLVRRSSRSSRSRTTTSGSDGSFFPRPDRNSRYGGAGAGSMRPSSPNEQWWENPQGGSRSSSSYNGYDYGDRYSSRRSRGSSSSSSSYNTIQGGGSRKTYSTFDNDPLVVNLESDDGRPIETEVELWQGPDNTSHRMRFYSQNGSLRPFQAIVDPSYYDGRYGGSSTMQIRNTGPMTFPITGGVSHYNDRRSAYYGSSSYGSSSSYYNSFRSSTDYVTVQGGSLRTMTVRGDVPRVRVDLETHGLPLMATIELWQGPGDAMQVAEIYNDCGRPFSTIVETPGGYGSTIAIRNEGPLEFPIEARIAY